MKSSLPLCLLAFLIILSGCAYHSPLIDKGGGRPDCAQDGSVSPLTKDQVEQIARTAVLERENCQESRRDEKGHWHVIEYHLQRINRGAWRVEAQQMVVHPHYGYTVSDQGFIVTLIIDQHGSITHYSK